MFQVGFRHAMLRGTGALMLSDASRNGRRGWRCTNRTLFSGAVFLGCVWTAFTRLAAFGVRLPSCVVGRVPRRTGLELWFRMIVDGITRCGGILGVFCVAR